MGYQRDHAIIVSAYYGEAIDKAHATAVEIFGERRVSPILGEFTNGCRSFFIPPDGSKEGWSESGEGDARRAKLIDYLESGKYDDGSSALNWVEVQFGDDNYETKIVNDSDMHMRS